MIKSNLKSGTALLVSFALITPTTGLAQTTENPFPCISPSGDEMADAEQFVQNLLATGIAELDAGTCSQDALDQALASGGDALALAIGAPAQVEEPEAEVVETAPAEPEVAPEEVQVDEAPAPEAAIEAAPEVVEEPVAEDSVVEEVAPDATAVTPTEEAPIVEKVAPAEESPVVEEAAPAEEAPVVEEVAPAEEAPVVEEVAPVEEAVVAEEPVPAEETPVAETPTPEVQTAPAEETLTPEVADEAVKDVAPEEPAAKPANAIEPKAAETETVVAPAAPQEAPAGEAGGEVVTDEERQAIAAANAPTQVETSAAATTGVAETEAEVTTQTITKDDVRTSDEDFETSVNEKAEPAAKTTSKTEGLSNFEKALLLGLGAVVVGAVLNNGDKVVSNSGDRVVIERDGELRVLKNDDELLQRPGSQVQTQTFQDGSTRTVVSYEDDSQIITIRSRDGTVLRRTMIRASDGSEVVLFDDTRAIEAVDFKALPTLESLEKQQRAQDASLETALQRALFVDVGRTFSLQQIRDYKRVRALAPQVELDAVTFATGSAAIAPSQAEALRDLGLTMRDIIEKEPSSVFLIEGHTDAVGAASYNLALSDRRAETVALALTEYFAVPPQNLITQGYGEADLKVMVLSDERANRRAVVRNISSLLK
ncbi:OmpA family protein [Falsihalocynthiibacter sp. S25ZX9]|uniref:OmpA family protein n=1 Tax=Falsihalocynthiibacter sp. S25ZX9 TaxID=3240870 RepID=UPI00350EFEFF